MASVIFEDSVEVPLDIRSLEDFRRWVLSEAFPERGRIDYVSGQIEVDMSPDEIYGHGGVRMEVSGVLWQLVKQEKSGEVYSDRTRIVSTSANLSAEPDVVFVTNQSLDSGRVRRIPMSGEVRRFIEFEGAPEMVAEIVSDSSVTKDKRRLAAAYFTAGVEEYWIIDARRSDLFFQIYRRGVGQFEPVIADSEGYQQSSVFQRRFKLERALNSRGDWMYDLHSQQ